MKLENQVVSLELAKKLKELGFKQESLFWWRVWNDGRAEADYLGGYTPKELGENKEMEFEGFYSAYTVAELGELIEYYEKINYRV